MAGRIPDCSRLPENSSEVVVGGKAWPDMGIREIGEHAVPVQGWPDMS